MLCSLQASLSSRLEKLFQCSFPQAAVPTVEDGVVSLKTLLGPSQEPPPQAGDEEENQPSGNR